MTSWTWLVRSFVRCRHRERQLIDWLQYNLNGMPFIITYRLPQALLTAPAPSFHKPTLSPQLGQIKFITQTNYWQLANPHPIFHLLTHPLLNICNFFIIRQPKLVTLLADREFNAIIAWNCCKILTAFAHLFAQLEHFDAWDCCWIVYCRGARISVEECIEVGRRVAVPVAIRCRSERATGG